MSLHLFLHGPQLDVHVQRLCPAWRFCQGLSYRLAAGMGSVQIMHCEVDRGYHSQGIFHWPC